jgi:hypothetical protein
LVFDLFLGPSMMARARARGAERSRHDFPRLTVRAIRLLRTSLLALVLARARARARPRGRFDEYPYL